MHLEIIASGLMFPEGPVALADGSVLVVEIAGERLTRIAADGSKTCIAELEGGPNGAALGPDGRLYVCNNGGMAWRREGHQVVPTGGTSPRYRGGSIQVVDLTTGDHGVLYERTPDGPLRAPNDIVFDAAGDFWFTDHGKLIDGMRTEGGLYHARADGSQVTRVFGGPFAYNGVGLSPNQATLYVADTREGHVLAFPLAAPGQLGGPPRELCRLVGPQMLDSLAVGAGGEIYVGAILPGGIAVCHPDGRYEVLPLDEPYVTNICFGGPDLDIAYVTLSQRGALARVTGLGPGLPLNFMG